MVPHCLVRTVKCLPLTVAERALQERKRLLLTHYSTSPEPTNQYSRPMETNRSAGRCVCLPCIWCMRAILRVVPFLFPVLIPNKIILIRIKALSLNMCVEFYRQAGLDYNASNIEFHFLSGGGGNFVAVSAMSIQLKHGWTQQQICTQNDPIYVNRRRRTWRKLNGCCFNMIPVHYNVVLEKLKVPCVEFVTTSTVVRGSIVYLVHTCMHEHPPCYSTYRQLMELMCREMPTTTKKKQQRFEILPKISSTNVFWRKEMHSTSLWSCRDTRNVFWWETVNL